MKPSPKWRRARSRRAARRRRPRNPAGAASRDDVGSRLTAVQERFRILSARLSDILARGEAVRSRLDELRVRSAGLRRTHVWPAPVSRAFSCPPQLLEAVIRDDRVVTTSRALVLRSREIIGASLLQREARERERERGLPLSPLRLTEVLDLVPDAVLVTTDLGRIESANQAAARLLDRAPRWLVGKPLATLVDLETRMHVRRLVSEARRRAFGSALYEIHLIGGRSSIPVQARVATVEWDDERRLVWVLRDVSELQAAERQVRDRDSRLRTIFECALDSIAVNLLEEGTYVDVNAEFERLTGYSREEILGRTPEELGLWIEPIDRREIFRTLRERGTVSHRDVRFRRRDGQELMVLYSARFLEIEGRRAIVSFARDVTTERRAERERAELEGSLRERSRLAELGAVVARVVHDLRNPLLAITLNAGAMLREVGEAADSPLGEYAADVAAGASRLDQLLSDLVAFTRHQAPRLADVDLAALARRSAASLAPLARERRISLAANAAPGLGLRGDEAQLLRAIENLLRNAIDAVGDGGGSVRLEVASPAPGQVRLTVRDDGSGILEGFDPFALFATTKVDGTGLGLAIAREIAEGHGGTLTFERLDPRGTAFHLDLPVEPGKHPTAARLPDRADRH